MEDSGDYKVISASDQDKYDIDFKLKQLEKKNVLKTQGKKMQETILQSGGPPPVPMGPPPRSNDVGSVTDLRVRQEIMSRQLEEGGNAKEERKLRKIYLAYARSEQLRPKLDQELGPNFFNKKIKSLEELKQRLEEVRHALGKGKISKFVKIAAVGGASFIEQSVPPSMLYGADLTGYGEVMKAMVEDESNEEMQNILAEFDCEYSDMMSTGTTARAVGAMATTAMLVARMNQNRAAFTSKPVPAPAPASVPSPVPTARESCAPPPKKPAAKKAKKTV